MQSFGQLQNECLSCHLVLCWEGTHANTSQFLQKAWLATYLNFDPIEQTLDYQMALEGCRILC
jgi:hypothetical protein